MPLTCGKCPLWAYQFELPWGGRIGRCPMRERDSSEDHPCDVHPDVMRAMMGRIRKAIAMREAEERAVS